MTPEGMKEIVEKLGKTLWLVAKTTNGTEIIIVGTVTHISDVTILTNPCFDFDVDSFENVMDKGFIDNHKNQCRRTNLMGLKTEDIVRVFPWKHAIPS
jgi:hypothetical protein